jgi:hypothetical protein
MPLYNPLTKPVGVRTFFEMLGPVVPNYDRTTLRTGVVAKSRPKPLIIPVSTHPSGIRTAPPNMINPMTTPMSVAQPGMPIPSPNFPPSPMYMPSNGYLYRGRQQPNQLATLHHMHACRNNLLAQAQAYGNNINKVIDGLNRVGVVSPFPRVAPMTLPPCNVINNIPQAVVQKFPPNSSSMPAARAVPQHRQVYQNQLPIQSKPNASHTPYDHYHAATVPLRTATKEPGSSAERKMARSQAARNSPVFKNKSSPSLSKAARVTKALAAAAKAPSKAVVATAEAYENSFEAALVQGNKASDEEDEVTVVDEIEVDAHDDPDYIDVDSTPDTEVVEMAP